MNYDNFRQTVIIPQGKFREFIDQKPTARTKMLKELFHLEQFDLSAPTGILLSQTRLELSRTEGRLEELGPLADDTLKIIDEELQELKNSLAKNEEQQKKLQVGEVQYQKLKVLFEKIKDVSERLAGLQNDQELFQQRERQLAKYERAVGIFKEKLTHFFGLLEEMKNGQEQLTSLTGSMEQQQEKLKLAEISLKEVSKDWDNRTTAQQQCEDLKSLIAIKGSQEQLDLARQRSLKTEARLARQKEISDQYKKEISDLEKKFLDQDQGELTELHQVHHWWAKQNEIQTSLQKSEGQLIQCRTQLDQLKEGKKHYC